MDLFHDPTVTPNTPFCVPEPQPQIVHAGTSLSSPPAWNGTSGEVGNRTGNAHAPVRKSISQLRELHCLWLDTRSFSSLCRVMQAGPWHVKNLQGSGF